MRFIWGVVIGLILVPVLVVVYLASGFGPTAATDKPLPFETWLAGTALRARMLKEAPASRDLSTMTTDDLVAGAQNYKKDCAVCHGLPDQPPAPIGSGMFPSAPQLMAPLTGRGPGGSGQPGGLGQMERGVPPQPSPGRAGGPGRGESNDFWRIKNGIRLTGMPSFEKALSDDQIWQLVALLAKRGDVPPEAKAALLPDSTGPPSAKSAGATPQGH